MKKRKNFIPLMSIKPTGKCLNCKGELPKRRRKYCSDGCLFEFAAKHNHSLMRNWIIRKRGAVCENCHKILEEWNSMFNRKIPEWDKIIIDHKIPIALGGEEFGEENIWILCTSCNKEKTRNDMKLIHRARNREKIKKRIKSLELFKEEG